MDRKFFEYWQLHEVDFAAESPPILLHVQIAFYLGALAYSDLLRNGVTVRPEVEDFLVSNPLVSQR